MLLDGSAEEHHKLVPEEKQKRYGMLQKNTNYSESD